MIDVPKLRRLLAAASIGPLQVLGDGRQVYAPRGMIANCGIALCDDDASDEVHEAEWSRHVAVANLVCGALNALPTLLDEIEALRARALPEGARERIARALHDVRMRGDRPYTPISAEQLRDADAALHALGIDPCPLGCLTRRCTRDKGCGSTPCECQPCEECGRNKP